MRNTRLYDHIKELLISYPELQNSDKKLLWKVWEKEGFVAFGRLDYGNFLSPRLTTPESVTRCRRKIQELNPTLRGTSFVQKRRKEKEKEKGTYVFRENVYVWIPEK
jgi:hypothetical protein